MFEAVKKTVRTLLLARSSCHCAQIAIVFGLPLCQLIWDYLGTGEQVAAHRLIDQQSIGDEQQRLPASFGIELRWRIWQILCFEKSRVSTGLDGRAFHVPDLSLHTLMTFVGIDQRL